MDASRGTSPYLREKASARSSADTNKVKRGRRSPMSSICDLDMPGLSGLAVQEKLSETAPLLPVVFLTGRGTSRLASRQ